MKEFEENFNNRYNYPYLFVNDVEFTNEFKSQVKNQTKANVEFGIIPKKFWSIPEWMDEKELEIQLEKLKNFYNGNLLSYHHMCRYYSGFFAQYDLTLKYDYFWRMVPSK